MDLDDLATSEWGRGSAWDDKVTRAQQRIAATDWHAVLAQPCDGTCQIPEVRRLALRPLD